MLKIRLRRMGSRHRPFYRFVVSDSRRVPTATAVDELGHYNPLLRPAEIRVDFAKVEHWLARGAQTSATVKKLLAQARKATPLIAVPAERPVTAPPPAAEATAEPIAAEPIAAEPIAEAPPAEERVAEVAAEVSAEPAAGETASEAAPA